jgi:hypothetical protein
VVIGGDTTPYALVELDVPTFKKLPISRRAVLASKPVRYMAGQSLFGAPQKMKGEALAPGPGKLLNLTMKVIVMKENIFIKNWAAIPEPFLNCKKLFLRGYILVSLLVPM